MPNELYKKGLLFERSIAVQEAYKSSASCLGYDAELVHTLNDLLLGSLSLTLFLAPTSTVIKLRHIATHCNTLQHTAFTSHALVLYLVGDCF